MTRFSGSSSRWVRYSDDVEWELDAFEEVAYSDVRVLVRHGFPGGDSPPEGAPPSRKSRSVSSTASASSTNRPRPPKPEKLEKEFEARSGPAEAGQAIAEHAGRAGKNAVTMSEADRRNKEREFNDLNREFQRRQREFREDLNLRQNEEMSAIYERVNKIIKAGRGKRKIRPDPAGGRCRQQSNRPDRQGDQGAAGSQGHALEVNRAALPG